MQRDVWVDGEEVYRGFLEGCGSLSRSDGGQRGMAEEQGVEEGVRASRAFFGRDGEVTGRTQEEEMKSRVEWATCEVEFGEGTGLLEMELDDLPM